jgi:hypothetical protein
VLGSIGNPPRSQSSSIGNPPRSAILLDRNPQGQRMAKAAKPFRSETAAGFP